MDFFFPFIYETQKEPTFEPIPLYIEEYIPELKKDEEKQEDSHIIIIDL